MLSAEAGETVVVGAVGFPEIMVDRFNITPWLFLFEAFGDEVDEGGEDNVERADRDEVDVPEWPSVPMAGSFWGFQGFHG